MNKLNSIYLRRKSKLILKGSDRQFSATDDKACGKPTGNVLVNVATILKNIESLGYTFSPQLIDRLSTLSESEASLFYSQLVTDLKQAIGVVGY